MKVTSDIIKHLDHLEDLLIYGVEGADVMCNFLESIYNYLNDNGTANIKLKIDGSPAVVASTDFHGETFVALKHSWEKGKRFHTEEEINSEYEDRPDLADKLKTLLKNLLFINIPKDEVWMGDFLFNRTQDCIIWNYPGKGNLDCVAFRANTVIYTYPLYSETANSILTADIGIAWHTRYVGNDFSSLHKGSVISAKDISLVPSVYQMVTDLPKLSNFLSDTQNVVIERLFHEIEEKLQPLCDDPNYELFLKSKNLVQRLLKYKNDIIKQYHKETGEYFTAEEFKAIVLDEMDKHGESLKSEKGKEQNTIKKSNTEKLLDDSTDMLNRYFKIQEAVVKMKNIFIETLNKSLGATMYYQQKDNTVNFGSKYIPCTGEGYVITDNEGNTVKLVNRLEFSSANFDDNIIKGWNK